MIDPDKVEGTGHLAEPHTREDVGWTDRRRGQLQVCLYALGFPSFHPGLFPRAVDPRRRPLPLMDDSFGSHMMN